MDEKELSDPLNNVSLIKGNPAVLLFSENMDRQSWSEWLGIVLLLTDTEYLTTWQCGERKKHESHLRRASVAIRVNGLVLEADLSSVNSLLRRWSLFAQRAHQLIKVR